MEDCATTPISSPKTPSDPKNCARLRPVARKNVCRLRRRPAGRKGRQLNFLLSTVSFLAQRAPLVPCPGRGYEIRVDARFDLFDHTADLGIWICAASLAELVQPATDGLYAAIGELSPGKPESESSWEICDEDPAVALRDYMAELLVLFDRDNRMLPAPVVEEFSEKRLAVSGRTHGIDEEKSSLLREVKAITYHELEIRPVSGGFEATLIVDI